MLDIENEEFDVQMAAPIDEHYKIDHKQLNRLLGKVLGVLDMSVPNKQQHNAAVVAVRIAFDATYDHMMALTSPDASFGREGCYAVEPKYD